MNYQTLNEKQKIIFKRIESYYNDILIGYQAELLRIIVIGTAGIRKTYLIKTIRGWFQEMVRIRSKSPVLILASTGVTTFNINGMTIHSNLSILIITNKSLDLNDEWLKQLQDRFKDVQYIIINKKSMIKCWILILIDMRLWQAFSKHNNKPFGGRSVIMVGNFG